MTRATEPRSDAYGAIWPGGVPAVATFPPAPRLPALDGTTIAFVWDYVFRGDEIFPILGEALAAAFPSMRFVNYDVFGPTFGGDERGVVERLPATLAAAGVDAVISGVGCCGACTPAAMRASAAIERAGIPTASLICEGFVGQARAVSPGLGCAALPVATLQGHVDSQSDEELHAAVVARTLPEVLRCLTENPRAEGEAARSYLPRAVVAEGSFEEINEAFETRGWSDGLPIVPPTEAAVERFLRHTSDAPHRLIGAVQPSGAGITTWNVAVNGVMAGCRPEHMPLLVAIAEIAADPRHGIEHSGDTTGGDPLIVLSGPAVERLGFNCANGAMRDGFRANNAVGRFLRLLLRNVVGFRPGAGDKCTFGHSARVVLAENEAEVAKLGWPNFAVQRGFKPDASVVTVGRFTGDTVVGSIYGRDPRALARYLADGILRQCGWELIYTAGFAPDTHRPLVAISPMVAKTFAKAGVDRGGIQALLFDHARMPAWKLEQYIGEFTNLVPGRQTLAALHAAGSASDQFVRSQDPDRLVPIVERAEDILLVVSGDPYRSNAVVFGSNGMHGFPVSREIRFNEGLP